MKRIAFFCFTLLLLAIHAPLYAQNAPQNLDFAKGIEGWFVPQPSLAAGYHLQAIPKDTKNPTPAVLLFLAEDGSGGGFGNIMQSFNAMPFRGKRIRLHARLRLEDVPATARAQMWLRVDRKDSRMGFFDNMGDRPVTSAQWQDAEIVGDIADDAEAINLGFMLTGGGKVRISAGEWEVLAPAPKETAEPLTAAHRDNLIAFTRLLGYVRHFHPSDEAAKTDWNKFTVRGMKTIEAAQTPAELAESLKTLFAPIAPTVQVGLASTPLTGDRAAEKKTATRLVMWSHRGYGTGSPDSVYQSERVFKPFTANGLPRDFPDPEKPYLADLGNGLTAAIPLACYADAKGTLPHGTVPQEKSLEPTGAGELSRSARFADVALAWNVMQHFYPYFDTVQTDWPAALRTALTSAAVDTNNKAFLLTLRRMIAALHDGHGGVYSQDGSEDYALPVCTGWVEGKMAVLAAQETPELKPGDVIVKMNGKPAEEAIAALEQTISGATPQWIRYRAVQQWVQGAKGSEVTLEVQTGANAPRTVKLKRVLEAKEWTKLQQTAEHRPEKIAEMKPGVVYLDIDRVNDDDIRLAIPQLERADGIVIDFRGYPGKVSDIMALFARISEKPLTSAYWNVPIITQPDHKEMKFEVSRWPRTVPRMPHIEAKVAFITDGRAISYAETCLGIVEAYKLGAIVGEPTAGTNGNVNPFRLPGGYNVVWTGMKVVKHNGTAHHGVGIAPTVPVSPTLKGIAEGRDELLDKAVEFVSP